MEPKALPPAKISAIKLFNKSSLVVKPKKIDISSLKKESRQDKVLVIKKQVIKIKDLISTNTVLKAQEEERKRKAKEQKRFAEKEEGLEKPKEGGAGKIKLPGAPKLSFLDRIKKFLFNILLGFIVYRLIPHIPKLMGVVKLAGQALDFITDWGGKLLNGLVTFVDWGYKAYDNTKAFLKGLGGENFTKVFDGFIGAMDKVIEASIIAAIAFGELGGDYSRDPRDRGRTRRPSSVTGGKGGQRQRPRVPGTGPKVTSGRGGMPKLPTRGAVTKGGLLGLVTLIPDILNSWDLWQSQGRGKDALRTFFSAVAGAAAGLGAVALLEAGAAALGVTGVGIPAAIALAVSGFAASSLAGTGAYNLTDAILRRIGLVDKNPSTGKPYAYKSGGPVTRGGKFVGGPARREVKKDGAKREVSIIPSKLKPGSSVGGDKEIQKVFPKSDKKDTVSPLGYTEKFYEKSTDIPFFGPIFGVATKILLGDKPSSLDYDNIGKGLNSWMNNTFSGEVLRTGGAFAGGGEVNAEMFMRGEDLTKVIAKSVEESISTKLDDTMNELMKQLGLKSSEEQKKPAPTSGQEGVAGPEDFSGSTGAEKTMHYLMSQGLTAAQAAGIAGNLQQESGFSPIADNGTHHGIAQWDKQNRWPRVSAYISSIGRDPNTLEGQLVGLKWEAEQRGDWREIKKASNARDASAIWLERFERSGEKPGMRGFENRMEFANSLLAKYGNYVPSSSGGDIQLGKGYGSEGSKIAGELGRYLQKLGVVPGSIHEHPEFGGVRGRHATNSFHYKGRAIDLGAYAYEQGPILKAIADFNRMKGVSPVELLKAGDPGHSDHVHVAYGKGGLVRGFTRAIIGEKGPEFVIDADSTAALEQNFPGFLGALNKANYEGAIQVLRNYASYEFGAGMEVVVDQPEPEVVPVMMPMPMGGSSYDSSFGEGESFDGLYNRG